MNGSLSQLAKLEILDLRGNKVSELPPDVENMSRLRILNLSENSFESINFTGLAELPLTELLLSRNKLSGTLIENSISSFPELQTLDVSFNQLRYLVPLGMAIAFPILHTLSLSMNRLQALPDMTSWESLLTLTVEENSISSIPNSFTSLSKLRHADFSSNDIRVVPPEVARMDNLSMLRLSGNPLRDRKFLTITTDELKDALASRLEPPPPYQEPVDHTTITDLMSQIADPDAKQASNFQKLAKVDSRDEDTISDMDDFATPPTSAPASPTRVRLRATSTQTWPVKQGGLLDRSNTSSSALPLVICSRVAAESQVRTMYLHQNLFEQIPSPLVCFADTLSVLSISFNQLAGETFLTEQLELPALKELNISNNRIISLQPLQAHLQAPLLEKLDVSVNRLSTLPSSDDMKSHFPQLSIFLFSSNQISDLDPESIRGYRIVDASSNDIGHLNPKLGLLAGKKGGLERLEVGGNRFRVPRWDVLEKGSEAVLRWLRDRVPAEEMSNWRRENGEFSDEET